MITVYNANNLAQQWFFQRAYLHLERENKLDPSFANVNKTFPSLESYFANIGSLIQLRSEYALIPSDEEPFEINANTRKIKIPSAFTSHAAITGDDMSEVITFTVDRYFDYVDLAGTKICVQWELPGPDGGTGISYITLVDLETVPGKIRFGWPLTDKLTNHAGKINFAVRFFLEHTPVDETDTTQFDYVLNTSPATITIAQGLTIDNPIITERNVDSEFALFVNNSQNPSLPYAKSPFWNDYREGGVGKDLKLDSPAAIEVVDTTEGVHDSLTLKAQALVDGAGFIQYTWHFKQGGLDSEYPALVLELEENDDGELVSVDDRFIINNAHYEKIEFAEGVERVRKGNEQYYVDEGGMRLHMGPLEPDVDYYERFTTLTIAPRPVIDGEYAETSVKDYSYKDVTGAYWVSAENYVGASPLYINPDKPELGTINAINLSTASDSNYCIVPTPQKVTLTVEPDDVVFIDGSAVELKVVASDDAGSPVRSYQWFKNSLNSNMEAGVAINDATRADLMLEGDNLQPGWYYVEGESLLNRAIEDIKSTHAYKVVHNPEDVDLGLIAEYCIYTSVKNADENTKAEYFANAENWKLLPEGNNQHIADTTFDIGDVIRLRVRPTFTFNNETVNAESLYDDKGQLVENLYTDALTYEWYIIPVDANVDNLTDDAGHKLTSDNINKYADEYGNGCVVFESPLDTNYLDVICAVNTTQITSYYCVVTNTLGNRKKVFTLADYNSIFNVW